MKTLVEQLEIKKEYENHRCGHCCKRLGSNRFPCGHFYHPYCIFQSDQYSKQEGYIRGQLVSVKCPICQQKANYRDVIIIPRIIVYFGVVFCIVLTLLCRLAQVKNMPTLVERVRIPPPKPKTV